MSSSPPTSTRSPPVTRSPAPCGGRTRGRTAVCARWVRATSARPRWHASALGRWNHHRLRRERLLLAGHDVRPGHRSSRQGAHVAEPGERIPGVRRPLRGLARVRPASRSGATTWSAPSSTASRSTRRSPGQSRLGCTFTDMALAANQFATVEHCPAEGANARVVLNFDDPGSVANHPDGWDNFQHSVRADIDTGAAGCADRRCHGRPGGRTGVRAEAGRGGLRRHGQGDLPHSGRHPGRRHRGGGRRQRTRRSSPRPCRPPRIDIRWSAATCSRSRRRRSMPFRPHVVLGGSDHQTSSATTSSGSITNALNPPETADITT